MPRRSICSSSPSSPKGGLGRGSEHHERDFLQNWCITWPGPNRVADFTALGAGDRATHGGAGAATPARSPGQRRPWRPSMGSTSRPPRRRQLPVCTSPSPPPGDRLPAAASRPCCPGVRGEPRRWTVHAYRVGYPAWPWKIPMLANATRDKNPAELGAGTATTLSSAMATRRWWKTNHRLHYEREELAQFEKQSECEWPAVLRL